MNKKWKEKIKNCDHILIHDNLTVNGKSGKSYIGYGCIKCGVTDTVLYKSKRLNSKEKFMLNYVKNNNLYNGHNVIDRFCDLDLAQAIYDRIKSKYPYMDDKTIMQTFKDELKIIRKRVHKDRNKKRMEKVLSLKPGFEKWFSEDVQKYKG